jgi:hypothetical protein
MSEDYFGGFYEGPPDDVPRHINGSQDEHQEAPRAFVSPTQRNTEETIQWYRDNDTDPPFNPDGMCLAVCRTARNIGPMFPSAVVAQQETPSAHRVYTISKIRRGMVMYFDTVGDSNPYGHIVTVVGRDRSVPEHDLGSLLVRTNSVKSGQLVVVRADYFKRYWNDEFQFAATWLNGQELKLPAEEEEAPVAARTVVLHSMFAPLQHSDARDKQVSDVRKIFTRASDRRVHWVSGTEASTNWSRDMLRDIAGDFGYRIAAEGRNDAWIAVRKRFITDGWDVNFQQAFLEPRPRGVLAASWNNEVVGRITVLSCHYLRYGRPDAKSPDYEVYLRENRRLSRIIGDMAEKYGAGRNMLFYQGDQNIPDNVSDTFMGQPLTSIQDELKKYESTGHGPIDVSASYDRDGRVSADYVRVLDDTELRLFADHYVLEAGFKVKV